MEKRGSFIEKLEPLFEQIEALPKPQRIALFVGIFIVILFLFIYFIFFPKLSDIKRLGDEHQKLSKQLVEAKKDAKKLPAEKEKMKKAEKDFRLALKALPNSQEIPSLLSNISRSGTDAGLQFKLFQPRSKRNKDFYAEIPVSISVIGNYHNIAVFFDKVAELDRIVNIRDITMKLAKGGRLSVSCQAVTYQFIKSQPKKKKRKKR